MWYYYTRMKTVRKIKNEKRVAITGKDFTVNTVFGKEIIKKGHRAPTNGLYELGGETITEGHGLGFKIPRNYFTKFIRAWDEIEERTIKGGKIIKTIHHKVDETAEVLKLWAEWDANMKARKDRENVRMIHAKIRMVRKEINLVKTGAAEARLAGLLKELKTIKNK